MTAPAQKELWIAIDVNGIPSGPADGTETTARFDVKARDQNVPEFAPHRVQKYVVAERVTFTQEWYATRWRRLDKLVREEATEEFQTHWFNVMANGLAEVTEEHVALDDLMPLVMQIQHSLSLAKQTIGALLNGVEQGSKEALTTVMHALIGALQTEDGAVVVRYCGHLERLLKEQREKNEALTKERDNLLWRLERYEEPST